MDVNSIIKLLDAGYTREEIQALDRVDDDAAAVSTDTPTVDANALKAAESSEPQALPLFPSASEQPPAQPPDTAIEDLRSLVDGLTEQLKALTKQVHANNIINSEQPPKPVQTAADILASIINPYTSNNKGDK